MGTEVGEIYLGLNINQDPFEKQLGGLARNAEKEVSNAFKPIEKQITGLAKKMQMPTVNAFKSLGKLVAGAFSIGLITNFTKSCLDLGSDLTEVQNVVDTTFKTMSGSVNAFAESAMMNYGMSETLAKQYIGTLGAMSNSMGFSEQAAYDMAASVTALTGDVASFYNLSTDEAFDKLKSIWTGETETLKSIGVLLTQTNLDQYALNNGFGKTTASMTEQEKVMLRYQYTMSALADASGDFAKTSGSWANQTRILSLQFDALKATLGQGFINLFTPIIQLINTLMAKLQVLAQQFKAFTEMISGNRGGNGSSTPIEGAAQDTEKLVSGLGGVTGAAKKAAKAVGLISVDELNVLPSAANAAGGGAGGVSGGAAADFGNINTAAAKTDGIVGEIDGKVSSLLKKIEPLTNALKRLWNGGLAKLGKFSATGLKDFYNNFLKPLGKWAFGTEDKGFVRLINIINEDLNGVDWDTISKNLSDFWTAIAPYAESFGEGLIDFFEVMSDISFSVFELLFGEGGALVKMTGWLNSNDPEAARSWGFALGVLGTALLAYKTLKPAVLLLGNLFGLLSKTPLAAGAASAISSLGTALTSLGGIKGLMTMDLATIFGAGSATEIGLTIGAGVIGGIAAAFAGFEGGKALGKLIFPESADYYDNFSWFGDGGFFTTIADCISNGDAAILWDALKDMIADIGAKLGDLFAGIWNGISGFFGWIWNGLTGLLGSIWNTVTGFLSNIWNGITSFFGNIWNGITGFLGNIWNGITGFFGNIWSGITGLISNIWNSITGFFTGIWEGITGLFVNIAGGIASWFENSIKPWFSFDKWKSMLAAIPNAFTQAFKGAANGAIGFFNGMIGGVESLVNGAIKGLGNLLKFVNKIPGVNIDFDSWGISLPRIPMLAEGGYVGVNQPQLAVIGDNKRHGEIVAPENKMYEVTYKAMQDALRDILDNFPTQGGDSGGDIIIPVYISSTKLDEFIVTAQDRRNFRNGGR